MSRADLRLCEKQNDIFINYDIAVPLFFIIVCMIILTIIFIYNIDTCTYIDNITHGHISFRLM